VLIQTSGLSDSRVNPASTKRSLAVRNSATVSTAGSGILHIYIEGDGRPFLGPTFVALDPTPLDPLMLRLMALDPAPSVYLGRPCYFGLSGDRGCDPGYWTIRRFAPEVLDSLAAALRLEAARAQVTDIEIYGHSGGGTLAVLLAARVPEVTRIITIGANLDTAAWSALHGYTPLLGSLNPVDEGSRLKNVSALHLVGSKDTNTPPALVESAAARMGAGGSVRVVPGYTHNCCWQEIWSSVLSSNLLR
jgi:pimeloyl-ACP methyl ester carboxylesterase